MQFVTAGHGLYMPKQTSAIYSHLFVSRGRP